jgi:hypothetical protein
MQEDPIRASGKDRVILLMSNDAERRLSSGGSMATAFGVGERGAPQRVKEVPAGMSPFRLGRLSDEVWLY